MTALPLDEIACADALTYLAGLPSASVNCVVTSPPYFNLRDYGVTGQLGLEASPRAYVDVMCAVFSEVRRVLRDDGTLWLNIGDSYSSVGHKKSHSGYGTTGLAGGIAQEHSPLHRENNGTGKHKDLMGVPWRLAFALQDDGWYLRSDIIWHKPNPMPESVTDRPTKAHEYVFLMSKSGRYWYDQEAIREPATDWGTRDRTNGKYHNEGTGLQPHSGLTGKRKQDDVGKRQYTGFNERWDNRDEPLTTRNVRTVWTIPTEPNSFAHFATMPQSLVERCILAGCPVGGVVLDPFVGSGTTALVARRLDRHYIGCDLNPEYVALATKRLKDTDPYQHRDMPNGAVQYSLFA